jgi:hypothetical protein
MNTVILDPVLAAVAAFYSSVEQAERSGETKYPRLQKEHLLALGCPYVESDPFTHLDVVKYKALPRDNKALFGYTVPKLLVDVMAHLPDDALGVSSLLGGLARSGCWRACLERIESAHALAVAICYFIDTCADICALDTYVEKDVLKIINEWLAPLRPWSKLPPVIVVATELFGSWWCDLALDGVVQEPPGQGDWDDGYFTAHVIAKNRPPFLPGLCPIQIDVDLEQLPDLGMVT